MHSFYWSHLVYIWCELLLHLLQLGFLNHPQRFVRDPWKNILSSLTTGCILQPSRNTSLVILPEQDVAILVGGSMLYLITRRLVDLILSCVRLFDCLHLLRADIAWKYGYKVVNIIINSWLWLGSSRTWSYVKLKEMCNAHYPKYLLKQPFSPHKPVVHAISAQDIHSPQSTWGTDSTKLFVIFPYLKGKICLVSWQQLTMLSSHLLGEDATEAKKTLIVNKKNNIWSHNL